MADHLGSIVQTTNSAAQVTLTRQYDAYGNMLSGGGTSGYAFTGREWDAETGLYYYRARYYDPKVGRFISEDPIGLAGGDANLYPYVRNSPVNYVDPSGLRYIPNMIINLDPKPYVGFGEPGPGTGGQVLIIPTPIGPPHITPPIGFTPPWWDIDFICTPDGWKKIRIPTIIVGGKVIGAIDPPPDWTPRFPCEPTKTSSNPEACAAT